MPAAFHLISLRFVLLMAVLLSLEPSWAIGISRG